MGRKNLSARKRGRISPYPYGRSFSIRGPRDSRVSPSLVRLGSIVAPEIDRVLTSDGRVPRSVSRNRMARLRYGIAHARSRAGDRRSRRSRHWRDASLRRHEKVRNSKVRRHDGEPEVRSAAWLGNPSQDLGICARKVALAYSRKARRVSGGEKSELRVSRSGCPGENETQIREASEDRMTPTIQGAQVQVPHTLEEPRNPQQFSYVTAQPRRCAMCLARS